MEEIMRKILDELGHNTNSEELKDTPKRVIKYFKDAVSWINPEEKEDLIKSLTTFTAPEDCGIVILKDIDFYSTCAHHVLPFYGVAHIGYLPDVSIVGISKLARIVDFHAKTLQIQEKFTKDIANSIIDAIHPKGVAVVVEGIHLCMRARGVGKQNSIMLTSEMLGVFRESPSARDEFLRLIGK
jgi:GTP cyclohydrolase IA